MLYNEDDDESVEQYRREQLNREWREEERLREEYEERMDSYRRERVAAEQEHWELYQQQCEAEYRKAENDFYEEGSAISEYESIEYHYAPYPEDLFID